VYIYIHIYYIYLRVYVSLYIYILICIYVFIHIYTCIYVYMYMYVYHTIFAIMGFLSIIPNVYQLYPCWYVNDIQVMQWVCIPQRCTSFFCLSFFLLLCLSLYIYIHTYICIHVLLPSWRHQWRTGDENIEKRVGVPQRCAPLQRSPITACRARGIGFWSGFWRCVVLSAAARGEGGLEI